MNIPKLARLRAIAVLLPSCASITRGTKEVIVIDSTPQAAAVHLSSGQSGTTPASFKVPRRGSITATVSKPGYITRTSVLNSQVSTGGGVGMAGNLIFGGIIGGAVDASSGAMYEHKPNPLNVVLERAR